MWYLKSGSAGDGGGGGGGLEQFSVSPRPLGFRFGTKGLGPGRDKIKKLTGLII